MGAGEPPQVEILISIPDGRLSLGHVPLTDVDRTLDALPGHVNSFFTFEPVSEEGGFDQVGQREGHVWDASLDHGLRVIVYYTWQEDPTGDAFDDVPEAPD